MPWASSTSNRQVSGHWTLQLVQREREGWRGRHCGFSLSLNFMAYNSHEISIKKESNMFKFAVVMAMLTTANFVYQLKRKTRTGGFGASLLCLFEDGSFWWSAFCFRAVLMQFVHLTSRCQVGIPIVFDAWRSTWRPWECLGTISTLHRILSTLRWAEWRCTVFWRV